LSHKLEVEERRSLASHYTLTTDYYILCEGRGREVLTNLTHLVWLRSWLNYAMFFPVFCCSELQLVGITWTLDNSDVVSDITVTSRCGNGSPS